ncbi:hypothetical protein TRFO_34497 [Tritrichomonas foetus]|uniref:Rab-GAP TBC domain-containing protein n=1 Tax=Tritrichomonas foetus TaxID=1144522 RepID=A0A1J4JNP6_9EUKA|nr:hypothetical protein TRFO_34497 [Tritrichomonas foetus]|eukprot:OHS99141.1 hypothetical protein TRFO_34497 [Tritrichomonas foetus]
MGDYLLCVLHSVIDEQEFEGCLSIYYSDLVPTISFARYTMPNNNLQVYPFSAIASIYIHADENENILNVFISNHPVPSTFKLSSKYDVLTFIEVTVANGILVSDPDKPNIWVPSFTGSRPPDTIEWICENSTLEGNLSSIHHNSRHPYSTSSVGANFSLASHRVILQNLIQKGKQTKFYSELLNPPTKAKLSSFYRGKNRLDEYLTIRRQWENRIPHQNIGRSKHNVDVENISKDLLRSVPSEKTIILLYNVLRTMITYAPDVGFAQGMVDVAYLVAELVLDDIESNDDKSQSYVFWVLNAILFQFGQARWFQATESANANLVDDVNDILAVVYPAVGYFICFGDYEMFKHCVGSSLTMFTRMFDHELVKRLWNLIFFGKDVDAMHAAVLTAIFCIEFPELTKSRVPDMAKIAELMSSPYKVEKEDEFLAIVAAICEYLPPREIVPDSMNFTCSLFHPLTF